MLHKRLSLNSSAAHNAQSPLLPLKALGIVAVATLAIFACAVRLHAQAYQSGSNRVSLSSGTVIPVILNSELSSNGSVRGDKFTASVDNSKQAYDEMLRDATIVGVVHEATPQSGNDPGMLDLAFTGLRLADGRTYPLTGSLTSMDAKQLNITSTGILRAKNTSKNNRLTYAGIGAGAGALIGILGNGKIKIEDILLGGLAGYGVGSILNSPEQVHDVDLKEGTPMGVLLENSISFDQPQPTRQQYHRMSPGGKKYYRFKGHPWVMDTLTGERYRLDLSRPVSPPENGSYYSYKGHPYVLDPATGERWRLD